MNLNRFIVLSVIIFLVYSFLFFLFFNPNREESGIKEVNIKKELNKICENINSLDFYETCHALLRNDYNLCNQDFCYEFIWKRLNISENFCESLESNFLKEICYKVLAIKTKNISYCGNYDMCYLEFARILKNITICSRGPVFYDECIVQIASNREECDKMLNYSDICRIYFPKELRECKGIDLCTFNFALKTGKIDFCSNIKSLMERISCELKIKNDIKICEKYTGRYKDYCALIYVYNYLEKIS